VGGEKLRWNVRKPRNDRAPHIYIPIRGMKQGGGWRRRWLTVWSPVSSKIPETSNSISMHLVRWAHACPSMWPSADQCQRLWLCVARIVCWYMLMPLSISPWIHQPQSGPDLVQYLDCLIAIKYSNQALEILDYDPEGMIHKDFVSVCRHFKIRILL